MNMDSIRMGRKSQYQVSQAGVTTAFTLLIGRNESRTHLKVSSTGAQKVYLYPGKAAPNAAGHTLATSTPTADFDIEADGASCMEAWYARTDANTDTLTIIETIVSQP